MTFNQRVTSSNLVRDTIDYAVCPGGEGAVLKTVGLKGLAGSNPVHGAIYGVIGEVINTPDCGSGMRRFNSYMAPQLSVSMAVILSSSPREG